MQTKKCKPMVHHHSLSDQSRFEVGHGESQGDSRTFTEREFRQLEEIRHE